MARLLPLATVAPFVALLSLVLVLALPDDRDAGRGERPVQEPVVAPAPRRESQPVALSPLERAVADLGSRDAERRASGESYLLEHADQARIAFGRLVRRTLSPRAAASVRYIEAVWAERADRALPAPLTLKTAPAQGLVHLIDEWTAEVADRFACIRRTGAAEGLPVTLVYAGDGPVDLLLSRHSYEMGPVLFFHDDKDTLARRWGVRHKPATAGLDRNGRLAFLHVGPLSRASLSERTGRLRGE